jgi:hypothetical protein
VQLQSDQSFYPFYLDPISPLFDAGGGYPLWHGQFQETHTFGTTAGNQLLVAFNRLGQNFGLAHGAQAKAAFPVTLNGDGSGTFNGFASFNTFLLNPEHDSRTLYQVSDDLLVSHTNHKLGLGFNVESVRANFRDSLDSFGTLTPQTLDAFYQGGIDPLSPRSDFTVLTQSFDSRGREHVAFNSLGIYVQDEWRARPTLSLTVSLRAEHPSNPYCEAGCFARLDGAFDSIPHDPAQPYDQAVLVNQHRAFAHTDMILWSPRFSFAWQPLGIGHNTVIRGGIGIFYDPLPGNLAFNLAGNSPSRNSYVVVGDHLSPNETTNLFQDAATSNASFVQGFSHGGTLAQIQASNPGFFPPTITTPDNQMHSAQYQRWSLEIQQAFGADTSFSVGYSGHHGIHEMVLDSSANAFGFGDLPAHLCSSPPVPPCADPRFSQVTRISTAAVSNYHALLVSFRHRFTRWNQGQLQANYTYSHALDEVSNGGLFGFTNGSSQSPQDPNNLRGTYGPAEYDVRHSVNASYVWELPLKKMLGEHGPDSVLTGWQVSGTMFARSGLPFSVFDYAQSQSLAPNNYFGLLYAVPTRAFGAQAPCGESAAIPIASRPCFPPQTSADGSPNPNSLFVQSGCETGFNTGTLPAASAACGGPSVSFTQGRNRFRGPGYFSTDLAVTKRTRIPGWEKASLGIGFQFFNLFNHPNFGFADNNISSPTFGQIPYMEQPATTVLGAHGSNASARMIQVKAQVQF